MKRWATAPAPMRLTKRPSTRMPTTPRPTSSTRIFWPTTKRRRTRLGQARWPTSGLTLAASTPWKRNASRNRPATPRSALTTGLWRRAPTPHFHTDVRSGLMEAARPGTPWPLAPRRRARGCPAVNAHVVNRPVSAADLLSLTKPRLSSLVLCTCAGGVWLAPGGLTAGRWLLTLLGTAGTVGAANALNCYVERDVDRA